MLRPVASWGDRIPHRRITKPPTMNVKFAVRMTAVSRRRRGKGARTPETYGSIAGIGAEACLESTLAFGSAANSIETESAIAALR